MSVSHNQVAIVPKIHSAPNHAPAKVGTSEAAPQEVDIAKLAYERFEARGSVHGFDREDWIAAEHELKSRV